MPWMVGGRGGHHGFGSPRWISSRILDITLIIMVATDLAQAALLEVLGEDSVEEVAAVLEEHSVAIGVVGGGGAPWWWRSAAEKGSRAAAD